MIPHFVTFATSRPRPLQIFRSFVYLCCYGPSFVRVLFFFLVIFLLDCTQNAYLISDCDYLTIVSLWGGRGGGEDDERSASSFERKPLPVITWHTPFALSKKSSALLWQRKRCSSDSMISVVYFIPAFSYSSSTSCLDLCSMIPFVVDNSTGELSCREHASKKVRKKNQKKQLLYIEHFEALKRERKKRRLHIWISGVSEGSVIEY